MSPHSRRTPRRHRGLQSGVGAAVAGACLVSLAFGCNAVLGNTDAILLDDAAADARAEADRGAGDGVAETADATDGRSQ